MSAESAAPQNLPPLDRAAEAATPAIDIPELNIPVGKSNSEEIAPDLVPKMGETPVSTGSTAPAEGEQLSVPDMSQSGHEHSKRAKDMGLKEALGASGCAFLREYAAENGMEAVQKLYDVVQAPREGKPFRRSVPPPPPPKKKTDPAPEAKKLDTPKDPVKVEVTKTPEPPKRIEAEPLPAVPAAVSQEAKSVLVPEAVTPPMPERISLPGEDRKLPLQTAPASVEQVTTQAMQSATAELQRLDVPEVALSPGSSEPQEAIDASVTGQEEDERAADSLSAQPVTFSESTPVETGEASENTTVVAPTETLTIQPEEASPAVIFGRFVEALNLAVSDEMPEQGMVESVQATTELSPVEASIAVVATEVATKLAELTLEKQEAALPIVQNISRLLVDIKRLQNKASTPAEIVAIVEQMREQIVQLFKVIESDPEKAEYLMQIMLSPDFIARLQSSLTPEELAKMAMHNVKLEDQFAPFISYQSDSDEPPVSHMVGRLAVLIAHPSLALQVWAKTDDSVLASA